MIRRRSPLKRSRPLKRKKAVIRKPKTSRKKLKAECDRLFSRYIRLRDGGCRLQGDRFPCRGVLQCAHLFSRRYFGTRWAGAGAWALCAAHHVYYTHHPLEWDDLLRRELGQQYAVIRAWATHLRTPDLEATRESLKSLLKELGADAC